MDVVNTLLTGIAWLLIEVLLAVLYRIARFYQLTSGQSTHPRLFWLPMGLWAVAALLGAVAGSVSLALLGEALMIGGGASAMWLGYRLLKLMTGDRS